MIGIFRFFKYGIIFTYIQVLRCFLLWDQVFRSLAVANIRCRTLDMYGVVSFFLWTYIHKPEPPNWHQCLISAASRMCFQKHGICRRGCGCGCCYSVIIRTITFFVVDSYYVNIYIYTTSFATLKRIASQDMLLYYAITLVVFSTYIFC